ncbi:MAG: hypothetical protein IKU26_00815 [Clostridia bacterium]|nr:hypothetical protein [Clostridia bacterium]
MAYNQIYGIVNEATKQALGSKAVAAIDTTTLAEVGGQVLSALNPATFPAFVNGLMGVLNNTRIKAKSYDGADRVSAYRNPEEFGLYMRKIQIDKVQDVGENSSFKAQDWDYYDGSLATNWTDRLFGNIAGFETAPQIVQRKQLQRCFANPAEMAAFIAMLDTGRMNDIRCHMESTETLARATAMGSCFHNTATAIDLGALYNTETGKATAPDSWQYDADQLRFYIVEMKRIIARLKKMNRIYNNAGMDRFTREDEMVIDIHSDFVASMTGYLENTLIQKFIELPGYNEVSRWQGVGTSYGNSLKLMIENDNLGVDTTAFASLTTTGKELTIDGVIAFVHDIDKYAMTIDDLRTVSAENQLQETVTTVTKFDTAYAVDPSEQGIVFYVGSHNAT